MDPIDHEGAKSRVNDLSPKRDEGGANMPEPRRRRGRTPGRDASPTGKPTSEQQPRRQPRYHVVLWNDNDHSYAYVIAMLAEIFGHPPERGFQMAKEVDTQGRSSS